MENDNCVLWENLKDNRKYKCKHKKTIVKGFFNDDKGSEKIEEEFEDHIKSLHKIFI